MPVRLRGVDVAGRTGQVNELPFPAQRAESGKMGLADFGSVLETSERESDREQDMES